MKRNMQLFKELFQSLKKSFSNNGQSRADEASSQLHPFFSAKQRFQPPSFEIQLQVLRSKSRSRIMKDFWTNKSLPSSNLSFRHLNLNGQLPHVRLQVTPDLAFSWKPISVPGAGPDPINKLLT